jgi:endonuclease/exonuclease/phosphatase family metal-dependent hydrolase
MKIVSLNIGIRIDNAKNVVKYFKKINADIVCLQEVVRPLEPNVLSKYRSEEVIRESLKKDYPYYFFAPEWVANKFLKDNKLDKDFQGMVEQGKLIMSKYPIIHGYNYFYHKDYEFDCDRTNFYKGDDHGRALQICDINVDGITIQIANVHGCYSSDKLDTEKSLLQSNFILEKIKQRQIPTILLGDFNVLPETKSLSIIEKEYKNLNKTFNISNTRPKEQEIDYIFSSGEFSVNDLKIDITNISDHYPLIVELELKKN